MPSAQEISPTQPTATVSAAVLPRPENSRGSALRNRLITGFLAVALLPFLGISFILIISGAQSGRDNAIRQLKTVLSYKQSSILIWGEALKAELGNVLLTENTTALATQDLQRLLQAENPRAAENASLRDALRGRFHLQLNQSQYYDEFIILDTDGIVLVSSNIAREGQPAGALEKAFRQGLTTPYLSPPVYNEASQRTEIFISYPIILQGTQAQGVLVGRARITVLNNILGETTGLGATGKTYLVALAQSDAPDAEQTAEQPAAHLRILAGLNREEQGSIFDSQALAELSAASVISTTAAAGDYSGMDLRGESVLGSYLHIPALEAYLIGEQSISESRRSSYATLAVNASVAVASILIALFLALQITRSIAAPLVELSEIAGEAASRASGSQSGGMAAAATPIMQRLSDFMENWGDVPEPGSAISAAGVSEAKPATASDSNEVGRLAGAFSAMTTALSTLVESLESRVENRTAELQQRSNYLQASAEVSRATASILDPEQLIERSVEVIGEYFKLYYVGLFLVDETGGWAILRAGTGEAGRKMIQRRHKLPLSSATGQASMIAWTIANARPRIAQIAADDLVRQANPDLPDTRSEAAIPLRSRGRVIGAISVQSEQFNAFDETVLAVLQSMADQLAVAIDNAHLFAESQDALQSERRAYSAQSQSAWSSWLAARSGRTAYSYRATPTGAARTAFTWRPEMEQAFTAGSSIATDADPAAALAIPISVRGATIGVLDLRRTPGDQTAWPDEEIAFLEGIAEQLAVALDSARLYTETQRKAEQERLVAELTGRVRASLDVETVLKTAAEEIYQTLNQPDLPLESLIVELTPAAARDDATGRGVSGALDRNSGEDHV